MKISPHAVANLRTTLAPMTTPTSLHTFRPWLSQSLESCGFDADVYTEYVSGILGDSDADSDMMEELVSILEAAVADEGAVDVPALVGRIIHAYCEAQRAEAHEEASTTTTTLVGAFEVQTAAEPKVTRGNLGEEEWRARSRLIETYGQEEEVTMDDDGTVHYEDRVAAPSSASSSGTSTNREIAEQARKRGMHEQRRKHAEEARIIQEQKKAEQRRKEKEKQRTQKREKHRW